MPEEQIRIYLEIDSNISLALDQNGVPVIKSLRISNELDEKIRDVELVVDSDPDFAETSRRSIALIPPHQSLSLNDLNITLTTSLLASVTERIRGHLRVRLMAGKTVLASHSEPVTVLPYNEWSGLQSLPEILAAFVMPNHPAVGAILAKAAQLSELTGYQSKNANTVRGIAEAVYAAIQSEELNYCTPPASFEEHGQRIRTPDEICRERLATCLDLVLLTAACLEQAGLHPIIVVLQEHAMCGVWLEKETFANPVADDLASLRNRMELGAILVIETTFLTHRPKQCFLEACKEAKRQLKDDEKFICALDVRRCRILEFRPLPIRVDDGRCIVEGLSPSISDYPSKSLNTSSPGHTTTTEAKTPTESVADRLDRWRTKLLDLSLRNRLLNFKESKKTLPLLTHDIGALEDALADDNAKFQVQKRPPELESSGRRERTIDDAIEGILRDQFSRKQISVDLEEEELSNRLRAIHSEARLAAEEGGANGLFVAIGILKWYESPTSDKVRLSPIILVPVDLERKSVTGPYYLTRGSDDTRANTTLLEMLRKDHGIVVHGLEPLPEDRSGVDVPSILTSIRAAIMNTPRWEVIEDARLGFFSFAKFLMWRDLQDKVDDLMQDKLVRHLIENPLDPFPQDGEFPNIDQLDGKYSPSDCFCPVDSDSSQLRAILAAAEDRSFVLEGPPGTGKSQTITNMIAHCLSAGKTILFVSEKMAALNVVADRLNRVGLGQFCLELHSNKANKLDVIRQLGESLGAVSGQGADDWQREANRVAERRQLLNSYVDALHRLRSNGLSVFKATSQLIGLRSVPIIRLPWSNAHQQSRDDLEKLEGMVRTLSTSAKACGPVDEHPWRPVEQADWSNSWRQMVSDEIEALHSATEPLPALIVRVASHLKLPTTGWTAKRLELLDQAARLITMRPRVSKAFVATEDWDALRSKIEGWVIAGRQRDALREELFAKYSIDLLNADLPALAKRWASANKANPIVRWFSIWALRREMAKLSVIGKAPEFSALDTDIKSAQELRALEQRLESVKDEAIATLGGYWKDGEPSWSELGGLVKWNDHIRKCSSQLAGNDLNALSALRAHLGHVVTECREQLDPQGAIGQDCQSLQTAVKQFQTKRDALAATLSLDSALAWGDEQAPDHIENMRGVLIRWQNNLPRLQEWCLWRATRAQAINLGLKNLIQGYEGGQFAHDQFLDVFRRAYYEWWLNTISDSEEVLRTFSSSSHEQNIRQYREADKRHMELTKDYIRAQLASKLPQATGGTANQNSEMGFLRHQLNLRRRHTSIRKLVQKVPNLLPRLKPCMLMSPMSIAQYLDPAVKQFDVVIFDEASQITPWDAIGAIARGKQTIVVGDPKQLPPTNFFQRASEDDYEDDSTLVDPESILDECMKSLRTLTLDWHYRSRHESLIHFSNVHYYNGRLLTFPSPIPEGMGVQWRHVADGVYDKGQTRTNHREAERVVEEVVRRLSDSELCKHSIGVVTFSASQQNLIEELLEKARREHPEIDEFFSDEREDRVFVKNLENVQGDQRDIIIFSICYGPAAQGRVYMNFGPINRDGGERRLNVAVTRARNELLVYSSLRAEQIDLARTRSTGARHLKTFLDYAERGPRAITEATYFAKGGDFDSPFEKDVAEALANTGWEVHTQIGCSGYRIDLAVVNPNAPGSYLLGIECDGANYHSAKTARDRDRLREEVLRGLGWRIARVWSTDWWNDPRRETQKLQGALEVALAEWRTNPVLPQEPERMQEEEVSRSSLPEPGLIAKGPVAPSLGEPSLHIYISVDLGRKRGSREAFYKSGALTRLREELERIVQGEWPVHYESACRRIAALWEIQRVTRPVRERFKQLLPQCQTIVKRDSGGEPFLWPRDEAPENYTEFRINGELPDTVRKSEEIAIEEYANGAFHILNGHIAMPAAALAKETATLFGFQRVGDSMSKRLHSSIDLLVESGRATRDGDTITLPRGR